MYSESQFPYLAKARVSTLRAALRKPDSGMPHVPDDIYFYILDIFEKEFKVVEAATEYNHDTECIKRKYWARCAEYDLPIYDYPGAKHWYNRQYGLPYYVGENNLLCWQLENGWHVEMCLSRREKTMSKRGFKDIVTTLNELPPFKIDF
jgi:hypothetical protein